MPIRAFAYVSEAAAGLLMGKMGEIVQDAADFNLQAGVTGVLLFDGARFLQYMEGPEDGLNVALQRAYGASSHEDIIELNRGRVGRRQFPYWSMGWVRVDQLALARISVADWTGFSRAQQNPDQRDPDQRGTALDQLARIVEPLAIQAG